MTGVILFKDTNLSVIKNKVFSFGQLLSVTLDASTLGLIFNAFNN
jgi:hypothetical protein